jgi:mono/diheme cytochrome c family protein
MLRLAIRWMWLGVGVGTIAGCDAEAGVEDPVQEVALSIEGVDPALLEALPPGVTREMLEEGRRHFVVCSVCHGLDGRGTQLGPPLRDGEWMHIEGGIDQILEVVRTGVPDPVAYPVPMPVMGGGDFDEGELRAVASYVDAISRSP